MKIYYIYHIKGKKIGCTQHPKRRTKIQGFNNYEILEEHTDIYLASNRELELQKQWGYSVDRKPYWKTIKMTTKEACIRGGITRGKVFVESGLLYRIIKANQRAVIQMDKLGNTIQEYESSKIASDVLDLFQTNITKCCKGKLKSTGGYVFRYA